MDPLNKGTLFLIPTVLASGTNDYSLSSEIIRVIAETDIFMVENLRSARRFISSLNIGKVIDEITFISLDKNTKIEEVYEHFQLFHEGKNIGILSESGCPGIADPGSLAVSLAQEMSIRVIPLVGPSSIVLSLMASGFNGQQFTFHGYLPIEKQSRKNAIKGLEREVIKSGYTQIFIETPYRNDKLLSELVQTLNPKAKLCVAANLTSDKEFIRTLSVDKWKNETIKIGKVPAIFLVGQ